MSDSIRGLLKYKSANFARYDIQIEQQSAVAGISDATSRYAPDLLVVGIRGGGRLRRMLAEASRNVFFTTRTAMCSSCGGFLRCVAKQAIDRRSSSGEAAKTLGLRPLTEAARRNIGNV